MGETIYNMYAFVKDGIISEVGISPREYPHLINTDEKEKRAEEFLAQYAEEDLSRAMVCSVPDNFITSDLFSPEDDFTIGMPYEVYRSLVKDGSPHYVGIYENAYQAVDAPLAPFVHYSIVENNEIIEKHV